MIDNIKTMSKYTKKNKINLRPHTKSHKTSEIAKMQIKNGAIGICVATLYEAYGIFNLSTILASDSEEDLENFAKSLGLEIKVETVCKYG